MWSSRYTKSHVQIRIVVRGADRNSFLDNLCSFFSVFQFKPGMYSGQSCFENLFYTAGLGLYDSLFTLSGQGNEYLSSLDKGFVRSAKLWDLGDRWDSFHSEFIQICDNLFTLCEIEFVWLVNVREQVRKFHWYPACQGLVGSFVLVRHLRKLFNTTVLPVLWL